MINLFFKNIYVIGVAGAGLITSTSIWLFRDQEAQKSQETTQDKPVDVAPKVPETKETNKDAKEVKPTITPTPVSPKKEEPVQDDKKVEQKPKVEQETKTNPAVPEEKEKAKSDKSTGTIKTVTVEVPKGGSTPNVDEFLKNQGLV